MNRTLSAASPRKRGAALIATGALLALGGTLVSASAASAVTQTPAPAYNYTTAVVTNPAERATVTGQFVTTDANGKSVQVPSVSIVGTANGDKVWAVPDTNNTSNLPTPYGLFLSVPTTHDLVDVSSHLSAIASASISFPVPKGAYNTTALTAYLETLAPGTEYDLIIGQTPFNSDGTAGNSSVLAPTEKYYKVAYQYNGLNTTSGVYESGVVGSTPNTVPVASTETVLTATADAAGGVLLTAKVQDPTTHAVDTTATGAVTFSATGLSPVTAAVTAGVATATISNPTTSYATTYSFTAAYSGNVSFAASTSTAQSVTTSAAPANYGQAILSESVVVPAAGAGSLTLSVPTVGLPGYDVDFGTAVPDLVAGKFTASASLPTATVTDTRYAKGDWTLNGVSTALSDGTHTIPASALSWAVPTITTPAGSGAVAGSAATSLATAQSLATFHDGGLLGQVITTARTTLSLVAPINQAAGHYVGQLTITLL